MGGMKNEDFPAPMTPDELAQALKNLGWKQVDLARRTGIAPDTVSRWGRGVKPIAPWVRSYLGMATALHELHRLYVAPPDRDPPCE